MACCRLAVYRQLTASLAMILIGAATATAQFAPVDLDIVAELGVVDPKLAPRLNQRAACGFDDSSLLDALTELSVANSLPIELSPAVERELPGAGHVTARFVGTRVSTVLDLLVRKGGFKWLTHKGSVWVVADDEYEAVLTRRTYPLGPLLRAVHDRRFTAERAREVVMAIASPTMWYEVGGPCAAALVGAALVVNADRETHADVAQALVELEHAYDLRLGKSARERASDALHRRLHTKVSLDQREQPLIAAFRELTKQASLSWMLDMPSLRDAGIDTDMPVTLNVSEVSVETALKLLFEELDLTWVATDEVLLLTTKVEAELMTSHRYFKVADFATTAASVAGYGEERLASIITSVVAPTTWDEVGGPGAVAVLPRVLLIAQSDESLDEVEQMLHRFRAVRNADPRAGRYFDRRREQLEARLRQPASLKCADQPLSQVVAAIEHQYRLPMMLDRRALADAGVSVDRPVSINVHDIPLGSLLALLLEPLGLDWNYRDEAIQITSRVQQEYEQELAVYRVADLFPLLGNTRVVERLIDVITGAIAPTTWEQVGGTGAMVRFGDLLIVAQVRPVQAQVWRLLEDLRSLYGLPRQAPAGPTEGVEVRRALGAIVAFDFRGTPFAHAVTELSRQAGVSIAIDTRALADAGIDAGSPVDLRMTRARLRYALNRLLEPMKLTHTVHHGVLFITSRAAAETMLTTRVFPLSTPGLAANNKAASAIQSLIARDTWDEVGGPGFIAAVPNGLVVSQTREVLEEIERWLASRNAVPQSVARIEE